MTARTWLGASPWSRRQAATTTAAFVLGVGLSSAAWVVTSGRPAARDQVGPVAVGVAGAAVAMLAQVTWLIAGRCSLSARRRALIGSGPVRRSGDDRRPCSTVCVAGPGLRLYHRADCPLAPPGAEPFQPRPVVEAGTAPVPCGVCRP